MKSIKHSFLFKTDIESLYAALTRGELIAKWWTTDAKLEAKGGAKGEFCWRDHGWKVDITLKKTVENKYVGWFCDESNMQDTDAWKNTTIEFLLKDNENGEVRLDFTQSNYKESPCLDICIDGWSFVLGESLRSLLETGEGKPYL